MNIDNIKRQLGLRLKEIRLSKGMKQEDLEEHGFSYRYYGKMERGLVNPTVETLARLCEIFQVRLLDLFSFLDTEGGVSEDREAVVVKIGQILAGSDEDQVRRLKVFLEEIL